MMSQSLQVGDLNKMNNVMRSSLETGDTCELCKFFIINKSPNTRNSIKFTMDVIKNNIKECSKQKNNPYCKDMAQYCVKMGKRTNGCLKELYEGI